MQQYANLFTQVSLPCEDTPLTSGQLNRLYDLVGSTEVVNTILRYGGVIAGGAALYVSDERQHRDGVTDLDVFTLNGGIGSDGKEKAAIETFYELARKLDTLCDSPEYALADNRPDVDEDDGVVGPSIDIPKMKPMRVLYRVGCMLTIHTRGRPVIQLIYSSAKTAEALISGFDFDVVQCAVYRDESGSNRLVRTRYAVEALETRTIGRILDYNYNSMRFASRLKKLHRKGFRLPGNYERVKDLVHVYSPSKGTNGKYWMDAKSLGEFIVEEWEEQPWTREKRVEYYDDTYKSQCGTGSGHPMRGDRFSSLREALDSCKLQPFNRQEYEEADGRVVEKRKNEESYRLRFIRLVSCLEERTDEQLEKADERVTRVVRSIPTGLEQDIVRLRGMVKTGMENPASVRRNEPAHVTELRRVKLECYVLLSRNEVRQALERAREYRSSRVPNSDTDHLVAGMASLDLGETDRLVKDARSGGGEISREQARRLVDRYLGC